MDFKLTEEQQMLQDTAARLVRDVYTFEKRLNSATAKPATAPSSGSSWVSWA